MVGLKIYLKKKMLGNLFVCTVKATASILDKQSGSKCHQIIKDLPSQ